MKRVLAICTTAIGDLMFCTPAIAALARAHGRVDMISHARRATLLKHNHHIENLYTFRTNPIQQKLLAWKLRKKHYDMVAILHANRSVLDLLPHLHYEQAFHIAADWGDRPDLRLKAIARPSELHVIDLPLLVARACGAETPALTERVPQLFLTNNELDNARRWLIKRKVDLDRPIVGLVVGGTEENKRWPVENFARLAMALHENGVQVVVIGSGNEKKLLYAMRAMGACNLLPAFAVDLRLLSSLIKYCKLLVSNDTGPLHLAHALRVPSVSFYGPHDPREHIARYEGHLIFSARSQLSQENKDHIMTLIPFAPVWRAVERTLRENQLPPTKIIEADNKD